MFEISLYDALNNEDLSINETFKDNECFVYIAKFFPREQEEYWKIKQLECISESAGCTLITEPINNIYCTFSLYKTDDIDGDDVILQYLEFYDPYTDYEGYKLTGTESPQREWKFDKDDIDNNDITIQCWKKTISGGKRKAKKTQHKKGVVLKRKKTKTRRKK